MSAEGRGDMESEGRLSAAPAGSDEAPDGADRPRRRPGCGTGCLLTPLGLILCAALFGLWWFSRLAEEQRRLSAHVGELVAAHQASRPEVPADQDAAPLYWSAVALYVVPTDENIKTNKPEAAAPGAVEKHLADNAAYLEALKKALARPQCSAQTDVAAGFGATFALTQNLRQTARFHRAIGVRSGIANSHRSSPFASRLPAHRPHGSEATIARRAETVKAGAAGGAGRRRRGPSRTSCSARSARPTPDACRSR